MSTIGDIVGFLEKIPIWKRLKSLPDEVDALKTRIGNLEAALKNGALGESCPLCETGRLKIKAVRPHDTFGDMGLQERKMQCDNPACGHTESRMHDPSGRIARK